MNLKPCAICSDQDQKVEILYHLSDYDVLVCRHCGLVYTNESFDTKIGCGIPEGYQAIYLPAERSFLARFERNLDEIEMVTRGKRGRLLDIGCGVGYLLRAARQRGWDVAGIDLDGAAVDIARQHGLDVRWQTIEAMPFSEDEFDVVTFLNVIEHLSAPRVALEQILRVTKPLGLLVLETPSDDFLLSHLAHWVFRLSGGRLSRPVRYLYGSQRTTGHVYRFSRKTITRLLAEMGFETQSIHSAENPPFRLYLSRQNFRKGWLIKASNFLLFGIVFLLIRSTGVHSRMIVYARKVVYE